MTLRWERQGPGAGAKRGPSHRRVTQHKGDGREAAAGADLRSPATRNCGYRPAAPLPLPTRARPPARSPAFLSPLSLRTGRLESIPRLRIFGIDHGWGRGSRWLRWGSWAASLVRRASLPSPLSPVSARRPALSSWPARAVGRTLRRVGRSCCCCCCCCCARVAFGAGGSPEAGERGGHDPGPTWLKSASTSLSCRESRKVGAGS